MEDLLRDIGRANDSQALKVFYDDVDDISELYLYAESSLNTAATAGPVSGGGPNPGVIPKLPPPQEITTFYVRETDLNGYSALLNVVQACALENDQSVQPLEPQQSQNHKQVPVTQHRPAIPHNPHQQVSTLPALHQQPAGHEPQPRAGKRPEQCEPTDHSAYDLELRQHSFIHPLQSEVASYQEPRGQHLDNETVTDDTLLAMVKQSILCSNCKKTFDRAVICEDFLIQLNRPVQCACGCVTCTLCYRELRGCRVHNMSYTHGQVNTTANRLAGCSDLENIGEWDLELKTDDNFMTDEEVDGHVQQLMNETQVPSVTRLREGRRISISLYVLSQLPRPLRLYLQLTCGVCFYTQPSTISSAGETVRPSGTGHAKQCQRMSPTSTSASLTFRVSGITFWSERVRRPRRRR